MAPHGPYVKMMIAMETRDGDAVGGRVTPPEVGSPAPPFRLASAQGQEIALEDYRGVQHVVLWFSKGLF